MLWGGRESAGDDIEQFGCPGPPGGRWLLRLGRHAVPRLRGPLDRLDSDLIADNSAVQQLLGVFPRPFRPDAACWGMTDD